MPPPPAVDLNVKRLIHLYLAEEYDKLSEEFLKVFEHLRGTTYLQMGGSNHASLLRFVKIFLALFTQPDYIVPERFVIRFVMQNFLLSNILAMTPFRNTDGWLDLLRYQPHNFVKILTLYSARNSLRFDRKSLFDTNPAIASLWYNQFCEVYKTGLVRADVVKHMEEHLAYHDDRMTLALDIQEPYFGSTYVDGTTVDRNVKPFLNQVVRRSIARLKCDNRPNPNKIAVISDLWFPTHSVYRILAAYVKELAKKFHVTFFHSMRAREALDTSMFHDVQQLRFTDRVLNVDPLLSNDFQAVFFPDVGMTAASIMLANHRIAPIQLVGTGHSASTWGADCDYYVSGVDCEKKDHPEDNYSERLLLLPGMGAVHNRPLYELQGVKKQCPEILVNCPWSGQKIHARFLATLKKLGERLTRPVRLRMFPAGTSSQNAHIPFAHDVSEAVGDKFVIDIIPATPYPGYMRLMEEADLSLDSFHFSGCNTVCDTLFLRKPTICWEGDKWYNRIGPATLRTIGFDDFIAYNEEEYLEKARRLIEDDAWREQAVQRLRATDLDSTAFSTKHAGALARAIEYLIENHERLQAEGSREAIVIE